MTSSPLLTLLADGEFVSGQTLADALGVSRTAVWKQLNKLGELGLEVESIKGRGYRIPGGIELLDADAVRAAMNPQALGLLAQLDLRDELGSTNAEAMAQVAAGRRSGYVCCAERQSAGRGRRGRPWVSPFARNLYCSAVWEYAQGAAALEGLSLAVGVAVARALQRAGVADVQLKWPNDVLHGGNKLGGILLEMSGDAAGPCQVVVGIGINVDMPPTAGADIDQQWTDVRRAAGGPVPGRSVLLGYLLDELLPMLADFEQGGFAPWRMAWEALDAYAGQPVVLASGERRVAGVARGVDERGALRLETAAGGVQSVFGGEISLRPAS
ncbi:bifunctional biotin--[acetyl-CoA-carboxylase] ligase/biotin operon repressor BirA [Mangrovimicrobium sediminis]|uniref:Bifunctional ligase/repressor BirA n=1 Tax=Mangrovimicrobium sediminis TaxID=2562682 RepID=A0A4Z0M8X7_9GAMM|nr:bifunctional biotin--[acetyl-CoA-carboxylase] ligase/biotin operon repressor BirA [Haliea sp. SAOS-164]TGD75860.1 bifunctional biotin--[acetyl-CoA-carboxylase] ligase/biotin operon repressor BirA [Haliea sp. SAOS-164]